MIYRINTFNCFDDKEFLKLDTILNREKEIKKLNEKEVVLYKNIKNDKNINKSINGYEITNKDKIDFESALSTGLFKRIAWGEYLYNGRNDTFPDKYNFDDGAIWKVEKDSDGHEYLVKEINDDGELLRTAGKNSNIYISSSNCKEAINLFSIFKDKDEILNFILNDERINKIIFEDLSSKIENYVKQYMSDNGYIESKDLLNDIMNIISKMLKTNDITSIKELDNVIETICDKTIKVK